MQPLRNRALSSRRAALLGLLGACVAPTAARAEPAKGPRPPLPEIVAGASLALSGPSQSLGREMARGIEVCFAAVNQDGGVGERRLRFVALDDGYVPAIAGENMTRLIEREGVLAALGNVGTSTAEVTVAIAAARGTLLLGAFSGAGLLRKTPPDRYVINYRASYADETAEMVRGLYRVGVRPFEIAFFSQRDSYGDAGYEGAIGAIEAAGYKEARRLPHGRYQRNTVEIEEALLTLLAAEIKPRAVIMVSTAAPSAELVRLLRRVLPRTLFLSVSFVGGMALASALGKDGDGVIVTQVVPHFEADLPLCKRYRAELARHAPGAAPGFVSLEGYIVARIFVEGLRRAGKSPTREALVSALESLHDLDLGLGARLSYGPSNHQGGHGVWPTVLRDGKLLPLAWDDLKS